MCRSGLEFALVYEIRFFVNWALRFGCHPYSCGARIARRILSIRFLISIAKWPKSGLVSKSGKSLFRKANSSFNFESRIISVYSRCSRFIPLLTNLSSRTKLEELAFLVYGLPEFIRLGKFKRHWLVADRAVYFWLLELHC